MSKLRFCLIGDGAIAKYHKKAIEHVEGELLDEHIIDPKYENPKMPSTKYDLIYTKSDSVYRFLGGFLDHHDYFDYTVIASPSHLHREQLKEVLKHTAPYHSIICEKPAFMPWEMPIDSDAINIVLQLRYLPGLPEKAGLVKAVFVRDEDYFKTWKVMPGKPEDFSSTYLSII